MKDRLGEIIDEIILENERICFDDWGTDDIFKSEQGRYTVYQCEKCGQKV